MSNANIQAVAAAVAVVGINKDKSREAAVPTMDDGTNSRSSCITEADKAKSCRDDNRHKQKQQLR